MIDIVGRQFRLLNAFGGLKKTPRPPLQGEKEEQNGEVKGWKEKQGGEGKRRGEEAKEVTEELRKREGVPPLLISQINHCLTYQNLHRLDRNGVSVSSQSQGLGSRSRLGLKKTDLVHIPES
jgi:hypothetical protein